MTRREFQRLPRHPAYRYEYIGGEAWLSPRPRTCHALLELRPAVGAWSGDHAPTAGADGDGNVTTRRVTAEDWDELGRLFAAAFRDRPPFLGLDERRRRAAAQAILAHARTGGDGPLIEQACFVAELRHHEGSAGGVVVTLLPGTDLSDWRSFSWPEPPPADAVARRLGRPHLTWVFVHPFVAGQGVGTALLGAAVRGLAALGYTELASTFLVGNEASTLWHWRNGFRLATGPGSRRR
jgi:GNAT superfamily N-acetyltransferase